MDKVTQFAVKFTDQDGEVSTKTVRGDEGVYVEVASWIMEYLEEASADEDCRYDPSYRKTLKKLVIALKSGSWQLLLEPANIFLEQIGGSERFSVSEFAEVPEYNYSEEYDDIMERCESLSLSDLVQEEDE